MNFFWSGLVATGIVVGVSGLIVFDTITGFFGLHVQVSETVVGAILGASIALVGSLLTIYAADEARARDLFEKDRNLATSALMKCMECENNLKTYSDKVWEFRKRAAAEGLPLVAKFRSLSGLPDLISITSEEKSVFLRRGELEAANVLLLIDKLHTSTIRNLRSYSESRMIHNTNFPAGHPPDDAALKQSFLTSCENLSQLADTMERNILESYMQSKLTSEVVYSSLVNCGFGWNAAMAPEV